MGINKKTAYQIALLFLGLGIILISQAMRKVPKVKNQPVLYNHSIHVNDVGVECVECHIGVINRERATLPTIEICETCHFEINGDTEAELFVVEAVGNSEEILWERIYEIPDHVYFSHRRHVSLGKIECSQCHGDVQDLEMPPLVPYIALTMEFCMDCHEAQKINNDCLACHR